MSLTNPVYETEEEALEAVKTLNPLLFRSRVRNHGFNIAVIMNCFYPSTTEAYILIKIRTEINDSGNMGKWRWKRMTSLNGLDHSQIELRMAGQMAKPRLPGHLD